MGDFHIKRYGGNTDGKIPIGLLCTGVKRDHSGELKAHKSPGPDVLSPES